MALFCLRLFFFEGEIKVLNLLHSMILGLFRLAGLRLFLLKPSARGLVPVLRRRFLEVSF